MTPLYQDTRGPSQNIYTYSQEMGSSVTRQLLRILSSVPRPATVPTIRTMQGYFLLLLPLVQKVSLPILRLPLAYTGPPQLGKSSVGATEIRL